MVCVGVGEGWEGDYEKVTGCFNRQFSCFFTLTYTGIGAEYTGIFYTVV